MRYVYECNREWVVCELSMSLGYFMGGKFTYLDRLIENDNYGWEIWLL